MKEVIYTKNAPEPIGPYSQAILVNNTLYASGQIAINPDTNEFVDGDIKTQTALLPPVFRKAKGLCFLCQAQSKTPGPSVLARRKAGGFKGE